MTSAYQLGLEHTIVALAWTLGALTIAVPLLAVALVARMPARRLLWRIDAWRYPRR